MSGVHLTVEESIKLNMMRYFNCSKIEDITLVNPRSPESPLLSGFERIIDVVYGDKTRTIGYDRFDVGAFFTNAILYVPYIDLGEDVTPTLELAYPHLSATYGIDIPESEIDFEASVLDKTGACKFVIKSTSHYLKGFIVIRVAVSGSRGYPTPLHEWLLMGNLSDTGTAKQALTAPFKFVKPDGSTWATLSGGKTPQALGPDIVIPTTTNWTLDFEFMVKSVSEYNSVFAETIPGAYVPGTICFYNGLLYESHITHGSHGKKIIPNLASRHTLVCKNNTVDYYFNGVKVETWSTRAARTAFRGFRNTGGGDELFAENNSFIRKIRSWDRAIEGVDLENLFKDQGPTTPKFPIPDCEWLLNGKYDNTGNELFTITDKFKFVNFPSGQWATLTGGRTPQPIGPGVALDRSGDWIVDFEMLVKQTPTRNAVFQAGVTDVNGDSLMFYANALYFPYGNSASIHTFVMPINVPTRHTLRCVGNTVYYYMDGILAQSWPISGRGPWTHFRNLFSDTEQMEEDKTYLRNIRFWKAGMTDYEFQELLYKDSYPERPPVHSWPLAGNTDNVGSSPTKPAFAVPVAFSDVADGTKMANLTRAGNHPIGTSFDASGDWTITARVIDPTPGLKGFFTTENMLTYGVSSLLYMNKLTTYLGNSFSNNWYTADTSILMQAGKKHNVVMTKRGPAYRMYVDGVMVQRVSATAAVAGLFSHFGAYNGTASLGTDVKFSDLRLYDYGMSIRQVREFGNGDRPLDAYPQPDHEWLMNGTTKNTGKLTNAFAPAVKYKTIGNKQYATFTDNGRFKQFGVNLATTANWTIDMTLLYTSFAEYEHVMAGSSASSSQNGTFKFGSGAFYETYCTQSMAPPKIVANVPVRITMVCTDGKVQYYQDGVASSSWTTTPLATRAALLGFGTPYGLESSLGMDRFHFRNFRYYDRALTGREVELLLKQQ